MVVGGFRSFHVLVTTRCLLITCKDIFAAVGDHAGNVDRNKCY